MIHVNVLGLRALDGKFDSMMNRELVAIQLEEARVGADVLVEMYKGLAPKGEGEVNARFPRKFAESFYHTVLETGIGFEIAIETSQPEKREWLKHGTGVFGPRGTPIVPVHKDALAFTWHGEQWVLASVQGMKPNPWEEHADEAAHPLGVAIANKIGHRVVERLSQA